jgi:AcrR family transcriptional regulator
MPKRKPDDLEQKRQQIIAGALEVFSHKGFEQATNKDIAEAAGIGSPGLIYHYFKDKADLLQNVVEQRIAVFQLLAHPEAMLAMPPREALTHFAKTLIGGLMQPEAAQLMRVMLGEAARRPKVAQTFADFGPNRVLPYLARYLEAQMDAGSLRRTDPLLAARSFMGPLIIYALLRNVLKQPEAVTGDPEAVIRHTVDNFWLGLSPREESDTAA